MARLDMPGVIVTTGPARLVGGSWEMPVSMRLARFSRLRLRLSVAVLRLAVAVAPGFAKPLLRERLAGPDGPGWCDVPGCDLPVCDGH